jgi:hypothetical protein
VFLVRLSLDGGVELVVPAFGWIGCLWLHFSPERRLGP